MFRNILIVDDSTTARMFIKRCLEMGGFDEAEFYEASNGVEALQHLNLKKIDLILTDLNMPKMDGNVFLEVMRNSPQFHEIKIIVISSSVNKENEDRLLHLGASAVINKPISPMVLMETIEPLESKKEGVH